MMDMCPICFELYSNLWSKPCCDCGYRTIAVSIELINLVRLLINRGFIVISANCTTFDSIGGKGKNTQIRIEFGVKYPEAILDELPPDWLICEFNLVRDNQILQPPLTMLSCVCSHPPSECDMETIEFEKRLTLSNLEVWLDGKDPEACKSILMLAECL